MGLISQLNNPLAEQKPRRNVRLCNIIGTTFQTMHGATNRRWGFGANVAASRLVGKTIIGARFSIRRTGSPTGLVFGKIYDAAGAQVMIIGSMPAANVPLVGYFFDCFGFSYTVPVTVPTRIVVEYTGGDASNHIDAQTLGADNFDGASTLLTWFDGAAWNTSAAEDSAGCLWTR